MAKYRDEKWLREQYLVNKKSTIQIADECDVSKSTIIKYMNRFGIESRSLSEAHAVRNPHATYYTGFQGYEQAESDYKHESYGVKIHRLCAVAWFGWDSVVENIVHHWTNVPWDNRESNLETISQDEHVVLHQSDDAEAVKPP